MLQPDAGVAGTTSGSIRRLQTRESDAAKAAKDLRAGLAGDAFSLVMFFCSTTYDLPALEEAMRAAFDGIELVGCTTAGEIGPEGFAEEGISLIAFPACDFSFSVGALSDLSKFRIADGQSFAKALLQSHYTKVSWAKPANSFAILLIDGLSIREEQVTRALQTGLDIIPLVGGSAGDGLHFRKTYVFHGGAFHTNGALCVIGSTTVPFRVFKAQHFSAMDERMVVTDADSEKRIVREINGFPAAEEYARVLGVHETNLDPTRFAASPVVVMIDGTNYVRSIQQANDDGSLTFFCAIEEGLVLRAAYGNGLKENLEMTMEALNAAVGKPQALLTFDCILRKLEIDGSSDAPELAQIMKDNAAIGFNTYGEQYQGVHVNQTMVGLVFGEAPA